jgi:hypothetical protein
MFSPCASNSIRAKIIYLGIIRLVFTTLLLWLFGAVVQLMTLNCLRELVELSTFGGELSL